MVMGTRTKQEQYNNMVLCNGEVWQKALRYSHEHRSGWHIVNIYLH